jgi:hypothetical protein
LEAFSSARRERRAVDKGFLAYKTDDGVDLDAAVDLGEILKN